MTISQKDRPSFSLVPQGKILRPCRLDAALDYLINQGVEPVRIHLDFSNYANLRKLHNYDAHLDMSDANLKEGNMGKYRGVEVFSQDMSSFRSVFNLSEQDNENIFCVQHKNKEGGVARISGIHIGLSMTSFSFSDLDSETTECEYCRSNRCLRCR